MAGSALIFLSVYAGLAQVEKMADGVVIVPLETEV